MHGGQQRLVRSRVNFADAVVGQALGVVADEVVVAALVAVVDLARTGNLALGLRRLHPDLIRARPARWAFILDLSFGFFRYEHGGQSHTRNGYGAGSTDATQERAPAQGTRPSTPGRIQSGQVVAQLPCGISNSIVRLVRPHKSPTGCHPTVFVP